MTFIGTADDDIYTKILMTTFIKSNKDIWILMTAFLDTADDDIYGIK